MSRADLADRPSRRVPAPAWRAPRGLAAGVAYAVALVLTTGFVVLTQMPATTVTVPRQEAALPIVRQVLPQGWAFFTKSPRDAGFRPMALRDGRWVDAGLGPTGRLSSGLGFDRRARAQGPELAYLMSGVPESGWRLCETDAATCLAAAPARPAVNPRPVPTLCGPIGLVREEPIPWQWRRAGETLPLRHVVRLDVSC